MEFQLTEPAPGIFEIVQTISQAVGTFEDRVIAEKVMGLLEMDALNAARLTETTAEEAASSLAQVEQHSEVSHFDWSEDELEQAFKRLCAGEKVKDVADRFGKSWSVLRAKWAARSKRAKSGTGLALAPVVAPLPTPLETVTAAVEDLKGQTECALCGRYFAPSVESLEHCARCNQDA